MALRFMDANDYQPIGLRVITPKEGYTLPELLDEAKQGSIPDELPVKHQRIYDILDGKIPSSNSQNEAFKFPHKCYSFQHTLFSISNCL